VQDPVFINCNGSPGTLTAVNRGLKPSTSVIWLGHDSEHAKVGVWVLHQLWPSGHFSDWGHLNWGVFSHLL